MYLGPTREPTKEIEAITKAFENAAKPGSIRPITPCPAIDMVKHKRKEAVENAMYMGSAGIDHFKQTMNGLYQLICYRAEVAKQIMMGCSETETKALDELFDYCNNQIKEYLAIL